MFSGGAYATSSFSTATGFLYTAEVEDLAAVAETNAAGLPVSVNVFEALSSGSDLIESRLPFSGNVFDTSSVSQETVTAAAELISAIQEQAKVERIERYVGFGFATGGFASGSFAGLGDGTSFYGGSIFSANIEVDYAFSEGAAVGDQAVGNPNFAVSFDAAAAVSDEVGAIPEYPGVLSEGAAAEDVVSSIPTYLVRIEEVTTASTTAATLVELGSIVSEVVAGTDIPTSLFVVNSAVSETASPLDRPFAQYTTRPVVVNMAQATDTTEARLQWENINTFETTNWQLINTIE